MGVAAVVQKLRIAAGLPSQYNVDSIPGLRFSMKSALSFLVAVSVFSCPLICHSGHTAAGSKRVASCCEHCAGGSTPDRSPNAPTPSNHSDGCPQGICSGAIMNHGAMYAVTLDPASSLPVAVIEPALSTAPSASGFAQFAVAPWPDDGKNPGRALCCLYSTLLC